MCEVSLLDLPDALLLRVLVLLAPTPEDVAHAALTCLAFARVLRAPPLRLTSREYACAACGHVLFLSSELSTRAPPPVRSSSPPRFYPRLRVCDYEKFLDNLLHETRRLRLHSLCGVAARVKARVASPCAKFLVEGDRHPTGCVQWSAVLCPCGLQVGHAERHPAVVRAVVPVFYLPLLRRRLAGGGLDPAPPAWLRPLGQQRCAGAPGKLCGSVLADSQAVLSQSCSILNRGTTPGRFLNSLSPGACVRANPRPMQLSRWRFSVEDLCCAACGAHVGLAFGSLLVDEHPWMALHAHEEPQSDNSVHPCSGRAALFEHALLPEK